MIREQEAFLRRLMIVADIRDLTGIPFHGIFYFGKSLKKRIK
ncbi:MAG: hypothetical protein V1933_05665 [Candidatus Omnitrophota bacterium]